MHRTFLSCEFMTQLMATIFPPNWTSQNCWTYFHGNACVELNNTTYKKQYIEIYWKIASSSIFCTPACTNMMNVCMSWITWYFMQCFWWRRNQFFGTGLTSGLEKLFRSCSKWETGRPECFCNKRQFEIWIFLCWILLVQALRLDSKRLNLPSSLVPIKICL